MKKYCQNNFISSIELDSTRLSFSVQENCCFVYWHHYDVLLFLSDANRSLLDHLKDEYHHYMLQAAIFHEALSCLPFPEPNSSETLQKKRNHIPLMSRQTERKFVTAFIS
ncbi:hypothetical protein PR202_gn00067 [Eleusine coracana subsp. coracana]|uniref:Uncharacterized protein n=1 Tax=Eleusine coracana subsp. coracana TaxID=191504 RepID=A0AAV5FYH7_ELECO|nr:hypothetical protein PR202_gn00067 [Eleusine coracana subsp. coracana]